MATNKNVKGKYVLRKKRAEVDYEVIQDDLDSDIDSESINESEEEHSSAENDDIIDENGSDLEENDPPQYSVTNDTTASTTAQKKTANNFSNASPTGWNDDNWTEGDTNLTWLPKFSLDGGFLVGIPEDSNEMYFLSLFMTNEVLDNILSETNKYANDYIEKEKKANKLPPKSRFRQWPEEGISRDRLVRFIALTFYFGIVQKGNVKSYWSTDVVYETPFPKKIMKRDVIRQLANATMADLQDNVNNSITDDYERLAGSHFLRRIAVPEHSKSGKIFRVCTVCSTAQREFDRRRQLPKRKRAGHETRYECSTCNVSLCIDNCFEIYHTYKNYIETYIDKILK